MLPRLNDDGRMYFRILACCLLAGVLPVRAGAYPSQPVGGTNGAALERSTAPWLWPLDPPHRVTRGFLAPATRYSAGHRGIDIAVTGTEPVRAPADGVVSFAGVVAGRPVLSIAHADEVVSSVEPVTAAVSPGEPVRAGDVVGSVAAGGHCDAGCVHLGVRVHGQYVSPLLYLAGIPRAVLLPLEPSGHGGPSGARRSAA
jgi:murein DD-endopeptidase MepM/ murein hydrolase activator NlpD